MSVVLLTASLLCAVVSFIAGATWLFAPIGTQAEHPLGRELMKDPEYWSDVRWWGGQSIRLAALSAFLFIIGSLVR